MVPMRSVPHRVVCLLGLDDGVFPRSQWVDGDDVLARGPLTGERDVRSEDRQLLLDAVLAARDALVVCYTGAGEHTGAVRPPAVPLGELVDAVEATADGVDVVSRHPLQPHDPRNLSPGALDTPAAFSFDAASLAGARAAAADRTPEPGFLPQPLPAPTPGDVNLDDLVRFLLHPVREFLRGPMALATPREADDVLDGIPIDLSALEEWAVGDRFVTSLLAGDDPGAVFVAEQLRGTIPQAGSARARCSGSSARSRRCSTRPPTCATRRRAASTYASTSGAAGCSPAPCPTSSATGWSRSAIPGSARGSG